MLSPDKVSIQTVGKVYAGRASSAPVVDLFITLLSMGLNGYRRLLTDRKERLGPFRERLGDIANKYGELLLECPTNTISLGITLNKLARPRMDDETEEQYLQSVGEDISYFGAMLFSRCVSGTRVVPRGQTKTMGGQEFVGFGSSTDNFPHAYMTAACAIGLSQEEIDDFFVKLDRGFQEFKTKQAKKMVMMMKENEKKKKKKEDDVDG